MSTNLTYEKYGKDKLAVRGDKDLHATLVKSIGGRWNPKMRGGEGWTVPLESEDKLKELIQTLSKSDNIDQLKKNAKCRKDQNKYRRATSPSKSEDEDFESSSEEEKETKIVKKIAKRVVKKTTTVESLKEEKKASSIKKEEVSPKNDKNDRIITKIMTKTKPEVKKSPVEEVIKAEKVEKNHVKEVVKVEKKVDKKPVEEVKKVKKSPIVESKKVEKKPVEEVKKVEKKVKKSPIVESKKVEKKPEKIVEKIQPDDRKKYFDEKKKFYSQFARDDFEDISETSSDLDDSSSDDFPSPSPIRHKHRKEDYSKLSSKLTKR